MLNHSLLYPRNIAIVGASKDTGKPGGRLVINMVKSGFSGNVYPVNPRETEINGLKVYPSIKELPETDLAILAISPVQCVDAVEYMSSRKATNAFIIISAGFSEMGGEGRKLEINLRELAEERELSIIGPNCIGLLNLYYKAIFVSPLPQVVKGGVDFVSASGAFAVFLFEMTAKYGLKFGSVISVGNSTTIGVEEVLEYWDESYIPGESGKVKMLYVEQIRKPVSFYRHVQSLILKGCSVLVLKPGDTPVGARAAMSHTGAMAGDSEAVNYLIEKAGAIRCYSREEMVYTGNILYQSALKGRRFAIITHAGGPGVMLADQLQKSGIEVPEFSTEDKTAILEVLNKGASAANPIDILATANRTQLNRVVEYCEKMDKIDAVIIIYGNTGMEDLFKTYRLLHETIESCKKTIFTVLPSINSASDEIQSFIDLGHQVYTDEVIFGRCLSKVLNRRQICKPNIFPAPLEIINKQRILSDREVYERLDSVELPIEQPKMYKSIDELKADDEIEYPVVAKTIGILHKTEVGGVRLNLKNNHELLSVSEQLLAIKGARGIMVQRMISGVELYLGGKRHDGIGYSVHIGLGGIFVELIRDISSNLAPVSEEEALEMIESLKGKAIFEGFRNKEPVNKLAFAAVVKKFSCIFFKYPDIREIDINPLLADGDKMKIVDARMVVDL